MSEHTKVPMIYKKISDVMGEIGAIKKKDKNKVQGYAFRGIDAVYNALNPLLSKHGIFCIPNVIDQTREERKSKNGGTLIYTILTIEYTFYAEDGSNVVARVVGEAMDSGDKSCNKAMSAAQKYVLFQLFCIPTEEAKDTENETHEVAEKKAMSFDELLGKIADCTHVKHLGNLWAKYTEDIRDMDETDKVSIMAAKDNKKKELQEAI